MGWEVYPHGLYEIVMRITKDYKRPIEITENGCAYGDAPGKNGVDTDTRRIAYYRGYFAELAQAIKEGADVRGYHAWSLLDNFEWAEGYSQTLRPGLRRFQNSETHREGIRKVVREGRVQQRTTGGGKESGSELRAKQLIGGSDPDIEEAARKVRSQGIALAMPYEPASEVPQAAQTSPHRTMIARGSQLKAHLFVTTTSPFSTRIPPTFSGNFNRSRCSTNRFCN